MKDAEKMIKALEVFDCKTILYDSMNGEAVTFQDVIDVILWQKAEIERLTEENRRDVFNLNTRICELDNENAELQKQVDELKGTICELIADKCKLFNKAQQAVKDTAKEIVTRELSRLKRLKEQFDSTTYGKHREHLMATINVEIMSIKLIAKEYGVEVE